MKVTIFTVPRYFKPPFALIQYNAIRSWLLLKPTPEIILCGDDEGVAKAAAKLGVIHIPDVELSSVGTPLVNSVFKKVQSIAKNPVLAYISSDILLVDNFLSAVDTVTSTLDHRFMIVGQRWDVQIDRHINFSSPTWKIELRKKVAASGELHSSKGMDYHIFWKGVGLNMPPFVVGRPWWDNWFLSRALGAGLSVVDATERIFAVHSNHKNLHIKEWENNRKNEEAGNNLALAQRNRAYVDNANWKFLNDKLVKKELFQFQVTWTDTFTGQRSLKMMVMASDALEAKREVEKSNREITNVTGLIHNLYNI